MKRLFSVWMLSCFASIAIADNNNFVACKSIYALCTTAPCTLDKENKNIVNCHCDVKNGFSASQEQCKAVINTNQGKQIFSRYYPVKSYKICSNDRTWAYCLDKPCIIDKNDPSKATCACTPVSNKGQYVMVTDGGATNTCDKGITSSATIGQIDDITSFLKKDSKLKPHDIKVVQ